MTRDELLAAIGVSLDEVDLAMISGMARKEGYDTCWAFADYNSPLQKHRRHMLKLTAKLALLLDPDGEQRTRDLIAETYGTKLGEPLPFARPGQCLVWLAQTPIRAIWGGYAYPTVEFRPLDPAGLWAWERDAGARDLPRIPADTADVPSMFRLLLRAAVPTTQPRPPGYSLKKPLPRRHLFQMSQAMEDEAAAFLADPANAWWREQIKLGPVHAVELPPDLVPVQRLMFA